MTPETIHDLLDSGDWACAEGSLDSLTFVARELAERLDVDHDEVDARAARAIVTEEDPMEATRLWGDLCRRLRH